MTLAKNKERRLREKHDLSGEKERGCVGVCVREREGERERERERERARERESKLVPQVFAGCSQEGKQVYPYTLSFIPPCSSVLNR